MQQAQSHMHHAQPQQVQKAMSSLSISPTEKSRNHNRTTTDDVVAEAIATV